MEYDVECTGSFDTNDMSDDEVRELFEDRFPNELCDEDMTDEQLLWKYYHGDIDIKKFIQSVGKEELQNIIDSI